MQLVSCISDVHIIFNRRRFLKIVGTPLAAHEIVINDIERATGMVIAEISGPFIAVL